MLIVQKPKRSSAPEIGLRLQFGHGMTLESKHDPNKTNLNQSFGAHDSVEVAKVKGVCVCVCNYPETQNMGIYNLS